MWVQFFIYNSVPRVEDTFILIAQLEAQTRNSMECIVKPNDASVEVYWGANYYWFKLEQLSQQIAVYLR